MRPNFFTNLPLEITTNILSRLPLRSVAMSKCVCKPWLHLIESDYFAKSHLSKTKTSPALVVLIPAMGSAQCTVFEFEDEDEVERHHLHYNPLTNFDLEGTALAADGLLLLSSEPEDEADLERHDRHYNLLTNLDFPFGESSMKGTAADGFLLLYSDQPKTLYICNPLTRDYIELCFPQESIHIWAYRFSCGFGVSKISGQHKVVFINHAAESKSYHVYVYTLGAGLWRCVDMFECEELYCSRIFGIFANGNLHWAAWDSIETPQICCFDVETECISFFSGPPVDVDAFGDLSVLRDCLCVSTATRGEEIVIWLMKEYGVEESWTKEYEMIYNPGIYFDWEVCEPVCPIKVFKDGDILMLWDDHLLVYYSNETKTTQQLGMFNDGPEFIYAMIFTPSLLSLKRFGMENVISF